MKNIEKLNAPWYELYKNERKHLNYPNYSVYEHL